MTNTPRHDYTVELFNIIIDYRIMIHLTLRMPTRLSHDRVCRQISLMRKKLVQKTDIDHFSESKEIAAFEANLSITVWRQRRRLFNLAQSVTMSVNGASTTHLTAQRHHEHRYDTKLEAGVHRIPRAYAHTFKKIRNLTWPIFAKKCPGSDCERKFQMSFLTKILVVRK